MARIAPYHCQHPRGFAWILLLLLVSAGSASADLQDIQRLRERFERAPTSTAIQERYASAVLEFAGDAATPQAMKEALKQVKLLQVDLPEVVWAGQVEEDLTNRLIASATSRRQTRQETREQERVRALANKANALLDLGELDAAGETIDRISRVAPQAEVIGSLQARLASLLPTKPPSEEPAAASPQRESRVVTRGNGAPQTSANPQTTTNFLLLGVIGVGTLALLGGGVLILRGGGKEPEVEAAPITMDALSDSQPFVNTDDPDDGDMAGKLGQVHIMNLIQFLNQERSTGVVSIKSPLGTGRIFFRDGEIDNARYGSATGTKAVFSILQLKEGTFKFTTQEVERTDTIRRSVPHLMLDYLSKQDEDERDRNNPRGVH